MPTWLQIILPVITGGFGIWFGQIIKWDFEKRKMRYEKRKRFIFLIRETVTGDHFSKWNFIHTSLYSQLRPFLTDEIRNEFEIRVKDKPRVNALHDVYKEIKKASVKIHRPF